MTENNDDFAEFSSCFDEEYFAHLQALYDAFAKAEDGETRQKAGNDFLGAALECIPGFVEALRQKERLDQRVEMKAFTLEECLSLAKDLRAEAHHQRVVWSGAQLSLFAKTIETLGRELAALVLSREETAVDKVHWETRAEILSDRANQLHARLATVWRAWCDHIREFLDSTLETMDEEETKDVRDGVALIEHVLMKTSSPSPAPKKPTEGMTEAGARVLMAATPIPNLVRRYAEFVYGAMHAAAEAEDDPRSATIVRLREELRRVTREAVWSLERDPLDLMPALRAFQDEELSEGQIRECVRRWLGGLPIDLSGTQQDQEPARVDGLNEGEKEIVAQLFGNGPTWDGDIVSKESRDTLIDDGFAIRSEGWTTLTARGIAAALGLGLGQPKIAEAPLVAGYRKGVREAIAFLRDRADRQSVLRVDNPPLLRRTADDLERTLLSAPIESEGGEI